MSSCLDICKSLCMVSQTLTSPNFNVLRIDWTALCQSTYVYLQCSTDSIAFPSLITRKLRIFLKISLLTYTKLHEKQPVYLHAMLAPSLPSRSLRSNKRISLSVPWIKTHTGARAFHSFTPFLWNNRPLSVRSAISVATCKKHLKTHLFDLAFPPKTPACPDGPLMLRNRFIDLAVKHWFDWLIDQAWQQQLNRSGCLQSCKILKVETLNSSIQTSHGKRKVTYKRLPLPSPPTEKDAPPWRTNLQS